MPIAMIEKKEGEKENGGGEIVVNKFSFILAE